MEDQSTLSYEEILFKDLKNDTDALQAQYFRGEITMDQWVALDDQLVEDYRFKLDRYYGVR